MQDFIEYRFKINAYTPETIPLARLAKYLTEIAELLGEEKSVHFHKLEAGSTIAVQRIEPEALQKVQERTQSADIYNFSAYKNLNKLLNEDNATGVLITGATEVLQFLGVEEQKLEPITIHQNAEIDGELIRVGGINNIVPVELKVEGKKLSHCQAERSVAELLAKHLFKPVRLFGAGQWSRNEFGEWVLEKFTIHNFEVLKSDSLSSVVRTLQGISGDAWGENAIDDILHFRYGGEQ
jgi:hypothetical protein